MKKRHEIKNKKNEDGEGQGVREPGERVTEIESHSSSSTE